MLLEYCSDCKKQTEVVSDHAAGDMVCTECGLVLESHSIDETSEWRTFGEDSNSRDPSRVGSPTNPLLTDGGLYTVISKPAGAKSDFPSGSLGRMQNRESDSDRALLSSFGKISNMGDRLGLVTTIKDRAKKIYAKLDKKSIKSKNQNALIAACLYNACKQEGKPRTVKEIHTIATGFTKKEWKRANDLIAEQLKVEMGLEIGMIQADDLVVRYCSHLGLNYDAIKTVKEAVKRSSDLDIRRTPVSVAAAVIYMVTQFSEDKKPLEGSES
ncbi:hypothetical protein LUZ60_002950 [Juncus effusus]|nr:hypothetical protein LUZ60_002950 [Juncus effusus]